MKLPVQLGVCTSCLLFALAEARGASIGLSQALPFVDADAITVTHTYSGGVGNFLADGYTYLLTQQSGITPFTVLGTFHVDVDVDADGNVLNGTLLITGDTDENGLTPNEVIFSSSNYETLVFPHVGFTEFGFPDDQVFEFVFKQGINNSYAVIGDHIGVILDAVSSDFDGSVASPFANDFSNLGDGLSTSFVVPEPASLALVAMTAVFWVRPRRATTRSRA